DRLAALHDAPTIVAAALDLVDQLPELPPDVANPQVAATPVEAHPPGVSKAIRPDLRPGPGALREWVVGRDRVGTARTPAIDGGSVRLTVNRDTRVPSARPGFSA